MTSQAPGGGAGSNLEGARSQAAVEPLASERALGKLRSGLHEAAIAAPARADVQRPMLQGPTALTEAALNSELVTGKPVGASEVSESTVAHIKEGTVTSQAPGGGEDSNLEGARNQAAVEPPASERVLGKLRSGLHKRRRLRPRPTPT